LGNLEKRDHLEDSGLAGRIILKCMDWTDLAQVRVRWRALLNAVMNVRVPSIAVNFFTSREPGSISRMILFYEVSSLRFF
jgi:hypothetical protein